MKDNIALSIRQPWADLVMTGLKIIECRDWRPSDALLGEEFYIHASKAVDERALAHFDATGELRVAERMMRGRSFPPLSLGALIGKVRLHAIHEYHGPEAFHKHESWHLCTPDVFMPARFGLELRVVSLLPDPIPCSGQLKFFRFDPALLERKPQEAGV